MNNVLVLLQSIHGLGGLLSKVSVTISDSALNQHLHDLQDLEKAPTNRKLQKFIDNRLTRTRGSIVLTASSGNALAMSGRS